MIEMRDRVKEGYEEGEYTEEFRESREIREKELNLLNRVLEESSEDSRILDLGCGNGLPFDRFFVDQSCDLVGVDIAKNHVEEARKMVPEAEFIQGDFFEQNFDDNSFSAVVSFYAIFHIPREEHEELFNMINDWLEENGVMLVTVGAGEMDQHSSDFAGSEMVWSSYSQEKNLEIIKKSGFEILGTYEEKSEDEHHLWVLAKNSN